VVVLGGRVVMEDTLEQALRSIVGAAQLGQGDDDTVLSEDPTELLAQAIKAFGDADTALREGNLALYQIRVNNASRLLQRAAELLGVNVEELLAPEPDPSASDAPADGSSDAPAEPQESTAPS
ncbi:MAG: hypothetical protein ACI867_001416, partial [Glaciecola sp.]